jgi:hypothetical protein
MEILELFDDLDLEEEHLNSEVAVLMDMLPTFKFVETFAQGTLN